MNIQNNYFRVNNIGFSGHNKSIDKNGKLEHSFYYLYDTKKYDKCFVELYNIGKDKNGNIHIVQGKPEELPLKSGETLKTGVNIYSDEEQNFGFAYRFKLIDKKGKESFAFDNGDVIGISDKDPQNKFNIVLKNRAAINKNGPMQLIMIDSYYPEVTGKDEKTGKPTVSESLRGAVLSSVRTHANKLGGKLGGITNNLNQIENEGITRIVGTPFTKDTVSSHKYWTENAYQISPDFGNENDFKNLQIELFKKDINWIADAALVNEGLTGVHIDSILRLGKDSTAGAMFDVSGKVALGVLPAKLNGKSDKTSEATKMKVINAPFIIKNGKLEGSAQNPQSGYNPNKPTYIQFYDSRLVSPEQKKSESPRDIISYDNKNVLNKDNKNTDNIYDITKHDDAVYPFAFEVNPRDLFENIEPVISKYKITDLKAIPYDAIREIADFDNFRVTTKNDAGNIECWDGNVDIPKFNFFLPDINSKRYHDLIENNPEQLKRLELGGLAARDYAVNSGRYWTRLTTNTQQEYIVSKLQDIKDKSSPEAYLNKVQDLAIHGDFPKSVLDGDKISSDIIKNVLNDDYELRRLKSVDKRSDLNQEIYEEKYDYSSDENDYFKDDYILKYALDMPLEALPVANNLMSLLSSPYISQRPLNDEELGLSKYDLLKIRQSESSEIDPYENTHKDINKIYETITNTISDIVDGIEYTDESGNKVGIYDEDKKVTEYGRYVLSEIVPDLTKYLLLKSLAPNADVNIENGHFDFSSVKEEDITMQSIGIKYKEWKIDPLTEEQEAQKVIKTISNGLNSLKNNKTAISELKQQAEQRFKGRTLSDYKVAEMIHDRIEAGLGWRIDATKDVADMNYVRSQIGRASGSEEAEYSPKANAAMQRAWSNVIDFWKVYNQTILKENPHAYTTAEITDVSDSLLRKVDENAKYKNSDDAERKFLEQTGITSIANYSYFFSLIPNLFTQYQADSGYPSNDAKNESTNALMKNLMDGWKWNYKNAGGDNPGFLFQSPEDGVINSYTFVGNHDKPRLLHSLALNMNLFQQGFSSDDNKKIALKLFHPELTNEEIDGYFKDIYAKNHNAVIRDFVPGISDEEVEKFNNAQSDEEKMDIIDDVFINSDFDLEELENLMETEDCLKGIKEFSAISDRAVDEVIKNPEIAQDLKTLNHKQINHKAVAMALRLNSAIDEVCNKDKELGNHLKKAAINLARGEYRGQQYDSEAFGTRPFEFAIRSIFDEAEFQGLKIDEQKRKEVEQGLLNNILEPAFDKCLSIYKMLVCMPGSPTDFAGDKLGVSGFETKTKNYHQQNRNAIPWEYLDKDNEKYNETIKNFYDNMNKISNLRKKKELSALNNGAAVALPVMTSKDRVSDKLQAILRYDDKGSIVISLHNNIGANVSNEEKMKRPKSNTLSAIASPISNNATKRMEIAKKLRDEAVELQKRADEAKLEADQDIDDDIKIKESELKQQAADDAKIAAQKAEKEAFEATEQLREQVANLKESAANAKLKLEAARKKGDKKEIKQAEKEVLAAEERLTYQPEEAFADTFSFSKVVLNNDISLVKSFDHKEKEKEEGEGEEKELARVANLKQGLKHGIDENIKFKDADILDDPTKDDGSYYYFKKQNGLYALTHCDKNGREIDIELSDKDKNSLILYKVN